MKCLLTTTVTTSNNSLKQPIKMGNKVSWRIGHNDKSWSKIGPELIHIMHTICKRIQSHPFCWRSTICIAIQQQHYNGTVKPSSEDMYWCSWGTTETAFIASHRLLFISIPFFVFVFLFPLYIVEVGALFSECRATAYFILSRERRNQSQ